MKAKCPHCKDGCEKCDKGFVEVDFAEGITYDLVCKKCGQVVGFHIDEGNDPPTDATAEHACCLWCEGFQDLEWVVDGYCEGGTDL